MKNLTDSKKAKDVDFESLSISVAKENKVEGVEVLTNTSLANDSTVSARGEENGFPKKKKLSRTNYATLFTHAINNVASVFVSTFLVSYIYKITNNYVFNIGLFYLMNYLVMGIVYFLASFIVDRTNRVIVYKFALVIRGLFMLCVVLVGENLAQYVILAGMLHGFSEGCYWSSYNVLKNELVPNKIVKTYSTLQQFVEKFVSVVVPIVLGKMIDANSFKLTAIIVMCVVVVQIIISFLIKSKRPENSSFNLKEFFADVKALGDRSKPIKLIFVASFIYGLISILSSLNTVMIMLSFNSDFSLGIFTSVFSLCALILILILNKLTKPKKHTAFNIIAAVLCPIGAFLAIFYTNQIFIAIYSFIFTVFSVVHSYFFDVYRNVILKKYGLYHDIAEFQCMIEIMLAFARVFSFGIMVIAGAVGVIYGAVGLLVATKILLGVVIFSVTALNILLLIIEKQLVKFEVIKWCKMSKIIIVIKCFAKMFKYVKIKEA